LVERSTRYGLLLHLGEGKGAPAVEVAMRKAIATLPKELARSITWDQGTEMASHRAITMATGVPVYFCDPFALAARFEREHHCVLRQYMPKASDLSVRSEEDLARNQRSLNGRPRKTLEYMTPSEKLAELIAQSG
jgi:IS30 family transposase